MHVLRACAGALALSLTLSAVSPAIARAPAALPVAQPIPAPGAAINYALSARQIAASCAAEIKRARSAVDAIAKRPARAASRANVLLPLEDATADLNDRLVAQTLLTSVSTDRAVRDASLACQTDQGNFSVEVAARPDVYRALLAVRAHGAAGSAYENTLLDLWIVASQRSGAGLPGAQRSEVVKLQQQLNDLQNQFGANLGNDTTAIDISVDEAAGLSTEFLSSLKKNATGGYTVPANESTADQYLQNAKSGAARKRYWLAYHDRQGEKNTALLRKAIAVRDRIAQLLGYRSWAAYVLADRMARTPQRVRAFLDGLDGKLLGKSREELAVLAALKAADAGVASATIEPWDLRYYDNALRKTAYAVDQNEIRRYFPVEHTIGAVLDIYAKIFSVSFAPIAPGAAWNPEVLQYAVRDASGKPIGKLDLDLFPRLGKYNHFANFPLLPVRRLPGGTWRMPETAIIGNWPRPAAGTPATLSHDDVTTFFHEFGHAMAALLATAPYETLSSGFRQDFIEAPSQMLENWTWQPAIIKAISAHVQSGAPLPDALIDKLVATRFVDQATFDVTQLMYGTIDMIYHSSGPTVDTTKVWDEVSRTQTALPYPEGIRPEAGFGHLMGGYDAGYYGYLWSLVYAADMFTAFAAGGLMSPIVGMRYRQAILQPARTLEPDVEVRNFLGRAMSPAAFYRQLGIGTGGG